MTLTRESNGRTKNIGHFPTLSIGSFDFEGGHLWFKGTVHNGLVKYNQYCTANGIDKPLTESNVWAFARGGASSTPMLKYYNNLPELALYANVGQANVWQNFTAFAGVVLINVLPTRLRPDQIFQGLREKRVEKEVGEINTVLIHQLTFHESGHYSHARKAGATFWSKLMGSEVANTIASSTGGNLFNGDPYRDGSYPSFQAGARIGLAEGWATFTEFKITTFYYAKVLYGGREVLARGLYPNTAAGSDTSIERILENFDVYDRPMTVARSDDQSWFLHGLMWDLLDNRNEIQNTVGTFTFSQRNNGAGDFQNFIVDIINLDLINTFNLSPIFNRMGSGVNDPCELRQELISNYSNATTRTNISNLFIRYGYGCSTLP